MYGLTTLIVFTKLSKLREISHCRPTLVQHITHVGGNIHTKDGNLRLNNALIVPEIKKNLVSVSQLTKDNACNIIFRLMSPLLRIHREK